MRVRRLWVLAFASVLLVQGVSAQLTTAQVENSLASFRWRGSNAVLLRGFYSGKALHFNQTGQIVDPHPGLWGVDGWMFLDKIAIKDGVLTLRGQRVVAVLGTEKSADASLNVKLWKTGSRDVTLILPMPADESVLQRIFSGVFLPPDEPFVSAMPELWQKFFDHTLVPKLDPDRMAKPPSKMEFDGVEYFTNGKGVKPPKAIFTPDPAYEPAARMAKLQGTVVLWCIIGTSGKAEHVSLRRALGAGLDERAVAAVESWRFKPAEYQGKSIPVSVNIEVNFRLN